MHEIFLNTLVSFGAIPGLDLVTIITTAGWLAVLFVIFAESGLLIGFFLPGDSLLFTSGVLVHAGVFNIDIHLFILLLFIAAVAGDSAGYWFGRKTGPKIFKKPDAKVFKQSHIQKAQDFYEKHGPKTIIIARFVPIVRTFAPIVAGVGKMDYKRFFSYNIIGGALWVTLVTYAGYYLGAFFESMGLDIDQVLLPIIIIIIFVSLLPAIYEIFKEKSNRDKIKCEINKFWKKITKKEKQSKNEG